MLFRIRDEQSELRKADFLFTKMSCKVTFYPQQARKSFAPNTILTLQTKTWHFVQTWIANIGVIGLRWGQRLHLNAFFSCLSLSVDQNWNRNNMQARIRGLDPGDIPTGRSTRFIVDEFNNNTAKTKSLQIILV